MPLYLQAQLEHTILNRKSMQTNKSSEFKCLMCGMCCRNIKRYREDVYPVLKNISNLR